MFSIAIIGAVNGTIICRRYMACMTSSTWGRRCIDRGISRIGIVTLVNWSPHMILCRTCSFSHEILHQIHSGQFRIAPTIIITMTTTTTIIITTTTSINKWVQWYNLPQKCFKFIFYRQILIVILLVFISKRNQTHDLSFSYQDKHSLIPCSLGKRKK